MKPPYLIVFIAFIVLAGCGRQDGPGLEIHDTKYVAIDGNGAQIMHEIESFPCALDQYTGLTWEVKSGSPGLHDWRNTYSWYNPRESHGGELDYRGKQNGGECSDSDCDTEAFAAAVNEAGYCSFTDWRVPTRNELASISDLRKTETPPTTNMEFFPHAQVGEYWSGNDYSFQWNAAWLWNFEYGHDRVEWKASPRYVRLVRGEAQALEQVKD